MTLNLNGHQLNCTTLTASTRGIISSSVAGSQVHASGAITVSANGVLNATNIAYIDCGGNFDPSAGTWTPDNSQVNITSSYKAVKLGAAQTLYDLQLVNNTNVTGQASVTHLIKYHAVGANLNFRWLNSTGMIGDYKANASGNIDIAGRILYVANLYRLQYIWLPQMTNSPATTGSIGVLYTFTPTWNETVTSVTLYLKPSWASYGGGLVSGTPIKLVGPGPHQFELNATSANGLMVGHWFWNVTTPWASVFIGSPIINIQSGSTYTYSITLDELANVTALTLPSWLSMSNNGTNATPYVLNGVAGQGSFVISIQATSEDGTGVSYLNFTISGWDAVVLAPLSTEAMFLIIIFLSLSFLFTILYYRDEKIGLLTGMLWILTGLVALVMISNILTLITIIPGIYYIIGGIES